MTPLRGDGAGGAGPTAERPTAGGPLTESALEDALLRLAAAQELDQRRRAALKARVLGAAVATAATVHKRGGSSRRWGVAGARRLTTRLAAVATAALLMGGGGLAYASQGALPGEPLYAVKRVTELVGLAASGTGPGRARMLLRLAERRQRELGALAARDAEAAAAFAVDAADAAFDAAEAAQALPVSEHEAVIARLTAIIARQRAHLEEVARRLGPNADPGIMQALRRAGEEARMRAIETITQRMLGVRARISTRRSAAQDEVARPPRRAKRTRPGTWTKQAPKGRPAASGQSRRSPRARGADAGAGESGNGNVPAPGAGSSEGSHGGARLSPSADGASSSNSGSRPARNR